TFAGGCVAHPRRRTRHGAAPRRCREAARDPDRGRGAPVPARRRRTVGAGASPRPGSVCGQTGPGAGRRGDGMNDGGTLVADRTPLARLRTNEDYQPRIDGLDERHVAELVESGADAWPPLVVVEDGADYLVVDGCHRLAAASRLGLADLAC